MPPKAWLRSIINTTMKYSKNCEHCGHIETAYTYQLNVGKVISLRRLVDFYEEHRIPAKRGQLKLTNPQYTNFCHLAYFGLAQLTPHGWLPTELGIAFIYGKIGVQTPVAVMSGEVLPLSHEAWQTHEKQPRTVYVNSIDETAYKQHAEYAAEVDVPRLV